MCLCLTACLQCLVLPAASELQPYEFESESEKGLDRWPIPV